MKMEILHKGMKNSPTIYQYYVFQVLYTLLNDLSITFVHYMDGILLTHYDFNESEENFQLALTSLSNIGLRVGSEKINKSCLTIIWNCL